MSQLPSLRQSIIRRVMDITLALTGLIVLSPLLLLIALAIVIETGFPVFYVQTRIARGGKTFRMYKFRKFRASCDGGSPLTMKDDTRMTRLGEFLARTKLDEMPQLYNIIRGDMSIVGPRPESLAFAGDFTEQVRPLLMHRPGIFGPSQVAFRNECALYPAGMDPVQFYHETLFPAKAALDLAYYAQRTVWTDIVWIVRGILAVLGKAPPEHLSAAKSVGKRQVDVMLAAE